MRKHTDVLEVENTGLKIWATAPNKLGQTILTLAVKARRTSNRICCKRNISNIESIPNSVLTN